MGGNGLPSSGELRDASDRDPEELFCLRWNDYRDNVVSTLSDLRREEDFFDVTLAVDGRQVRAHKLILSACSLFFRRLLRANPATNPIIVLWDVEYDDVVNILDFMYNGEVKVRHSNIQTFLALAERFRVRGLCQNETASGRGSPSPPLAATTNANAKSPTPRHRRRSEDSSPSANRSWHQPPLSPTPGPGPSSSRRPSTDEVPANKKARYRAAGEEEEDPLPPEVSIKEESGGHRRSSSRPELLDTSGHDDSQMSHSGGGSDLEYDYGGLEGSSSAGGLPPSLMGLGMPSGPILDPNTAKEFWRRAAALGLTSSGGYGQRGLSSPGAGGGSGAASTGSPGGAGGLDMPRRQRSVFSSQQVAQLEAYFRVSEYIDGERKKELSNLTNIPEQQIKVWFQNRRQKKKRESETDVIGDSPARSSGGGSGGPGSVSGSFNNQSHVS